MHAQIAAGILIPFIGGVLGAALAFFLRREIPEVLHRAIAGFAGGVTVMATFNTLIQPAIGGDVHMGKLAFVAPVALGLYLGIGIMLLLGVVILHVRVTRKWEGRESALKRTAELFLAVALHNIPKGMAVGVVYAGLLAGKTGVSHAAALTLALGIAMMNFSEGATVSTPLREDGVPKSKRFWLGLLSGAVEPVAAALTFAALNGGAAAPLFLIAFVTGAILELTMETMGDDHSKVGTASFALGFVLMIVLKIVSDVTG